MHENLEVQAVQVDQRGEVSVNNSLFNSSAGCSPDLNGEFTQVIDASLESFFATPPDSPPLPPSAPRMEEGEMTETEASRFLICTCCGISFAPLQGEKCYGKCQDCLNVHFNSFARLHVPDLVSFFVDAFPSPLHDVPPPGVSNATGSPLGGKP